MAVLHIVCYINGLLLAATKVQFSEAIACQGNIHLLVKVKLHGFMERTKGIIKSLAKKTFEMHERSSSKF